MNVSTIHIDSLSEQTVVVPDHYTCDQFVVADLPYGGGGNQFAARREG